MTYILTILFFSTNALALKSDVPQKNTDQRALGFQQTQQTIKKISNDLQKAHKNKKLKPNDIKQLEAIEAELDKVKDILVKELKN